MNSTEQVESIIKQVEESEITLAEGINLVHGMHREGIFSSVTCCSAIAEMRTTYIHNGPPKDRA